MYNIINIKTGQVIQIGKKKLNTLLKKHTIHYHHSLNMFCYTKKN